MERKSKSILGMLDEKKPEITTIKINSEIKSRLDNLKEHEKESYNETIKKMLNLLNIFKKSPALANRILSNIDRAIKFKSLLDSGKIEKVQKPINSSRVLGQSSYRPQDQGSR